MQTNVKTIVLNKLGYNASFPLAIVYTPKMYGRLEFNHLYIEKGILHTMFVIQNLRAQTETAKIILTTLEAYQLMSSLSGTALTNTQKIDYLDTSWIETTQTFMHKADTIITVPQLKQIVSLQIHDSAIMKEALKYITNA